MKNVFFTILLGLMVQVASAQIGDKVSASLKTGNSKELAKYLSANVELTIISKEGVYSKAQAEVILKDFFMSHLAKDFTVMHQGGEKSQSQYTIGTLKTDKQAFRVFYLIKTEKGKEVVSQLRIENQEE